MFEAAELGHTIDKETFEQELPGLREELLEVQAELRDADFPVIIVIGGVDGAGKGETVNTLLEWIDPRFVETFALGRPSDEEDERPTYWRFWRALPRRGQIGILFGAWHTTPIVDRVAKRIDKNEHERQLAEVAAFERLLVADGAVLIKLWMHLSKDRQRRRLRSLEKDRRTRWRVTDADWEHYKQYDRFAKISAHALRRTSTGEAPWTIIEASCRRYQTMTVGRLIRDRIRAQLDAAATPTIEAGAIAVAEPVAPTEERTVLSELDLSPTVSSDEYKDRLELAQGRLNSLARKAARKERSTVIVFEGADAAGKGGNIRRITAALDARMYQVVPIAAPTDEERAHPYLWRFWRRLPRAGKVTVFDRSWYGRVLVERVEGFCPPADWQRAYAEINDFEEQLVRHGTIVVKFWLHIDADEQLRRFTEREQTGFKRFKITPDDWRNRERWDDYERAVDDMVERTSTEVAPWTLVAANCKRHARLETLRVIADALEAAL